ncbi:MAG: c-type cytochrome [Pyrinomonadaceae bacterium]
MKQLKLFVLFALSVAELACGNAPTDNKANVATPKPAPSAEVTRMDDLAGGRALFNQNCAACHKENGTGGKMTIEGKTLNVDDLTSDKIKKFTDEKISGYIMNGVVDEGMPSFKDKLAEAQIREIVTYVRRGIQKIDTPPAR